MKKEMKNHIMYSVIIVLAILIIGGIYLFNNNDGTNISNNGETNVISQDELPAEIVNPIKSFSELSAVFTADESEIQETSSGEKFLVDPSKIRGGGPPKGGIGVDRGIPALDETNIKYVSVSEADTWIEDNELVLVLDHNGVKRVYPLQIMTWHEIVNDVVGGDPIAITYCPLCGSGIAYYRVLDGEVVKFGTSGKLFNSNLVMYDDKTDTYWQQIDGNAIVGELTGFELRELSVDTVVWRDYKKAYSDAEVLSQDTGIRRNYGRDPYGSYYEDSFLIFPVEDSDDRIHAKTVVFGIKVNGEFKAYQEKDLIAEGGVIEEKFAGVNLKVERDNVGIVKITNVDTGEEIIKERDFWFAWYAFHPETELYES